MKSLLIGEAATPDAEQAHPRRPAGGPEVRRIIHLRTEHLGPDDLLVAAKVEFDGDLDLRAAWPRRSTRAEARVRAAEPAAGMLFIEPDVARGPSCAAESRGRPPTLPRTEIDPESPLGAVRGCTC